MNYFHFIGEFYSNTNDEYRHLTHTNNYKKGISDTRKFRIILMYFVIMGLLVLSTIVSLLLEGYYYFTYLSVLIPVFVLYFRFNFEQIDILINFFAFVGKQNIYKKLVIDSFYTRSISDEINIDSSRKINCYRVNRKKNFFRAKYKLEISRPIKTVSMIITRRYVLLKDKDRVLKINDASLERLEVMNKIISFALEEK